ncbi:MAG: tetratricopeptide repeat protein [Caldilineaceae bacterium]|nr:tetratricopeptide repeat protein [Caldilineaceae bacterium]
MAARKSATSTATFFDHLKLALESFDDPARLGSQSPLAAPYFLGEALRGADTTPLGRGRTLHAEISRVLEGMWGGPLPLSGQEMLAAVEAEDEQGGRYDCLILELNYFKQRYRPAPRNQSEIYNDILHISRPTHDRHLRAAVERLGTLLLRRLRPAVRPEQPMIPPVLIGRDPLLAQILDDLKMGRAVSLSGAGGVGKTSLAAALADQWISPALFWYTFRPTFNDQLESLLFALGHFLHRQGASTLWHQLVADGGRIKDSTLALGLLRSDLASLAARPLLCFDELDFLRPLSQFEAKPNHVQLLEFLDSLRGHSAMILIGQRAFWESDAIYPLDGLDVPQLGQWLTALSIPHSAADVATLHAYTAGNLRLAELCIALYQASEDESFAAILEQLPQFHGLLPLWLRLERRLPLAERQMLQILSVFRTAAPADVWLEGTPAESEALIGLIGRRLVQQDDQGGVALLPALREVVYAEQPVEIQEGLHMQVAQIWAERGEYTSAAYHLHCAGQDEAAVALWYAHREDEIHRGLAATALAIFEQISLRHLSNVRQKELRLLRSELYELSGAPEQVIATLQDTSWDADDDGQVDASLLLGKAHDRQGQGDQALRSYANGLDAANRLQSRMVELHVQRSLIYLHERDMQEAWQEVNRARYLSENMTGTLHEQSGQLDKARSHYESALAIAQEIGYLAGVAKSFHNLGNVASRQRQLDRAIVFYEEAMATHEKMGNRVGLEFARSGIVAPYMQAGRYTEAIAAAERTLTFFRAMGNSFWIALNASNLAESHVELGNYAEAEVYAQMVLAEEEPHSHPYALFTLGRVRQGQGRSADALFALHQARQIAEMNEDRYLLAYCWEEIGKIQAKSNDSQAAASLDQALHLFRSLKIDEKAAEVQALLQMGDGQ